MQLGEFGCPTAECTFAHVSPTTSMQMHIESLDLAIALSEAWCLAASTTTRPPTQFDLNAESGLVQAGGCAESNDPKAYGAIESRSSRHHSAGLSSSTLIKAIMPLSAAFAHQFRKTNVERGSGTSPRRGSLRLDTTPTVNCRQLDSAPRDVVETIW